MAAGRVSAGRASILAASPVADFRGTFMALAAGGTVDNSGTAYVPSNCMGMITRVINARTRIAVDRAASTALATTDGILSADQEYSFNLAPKINYVSMEAMTNAGTAQITWVIGST